MQTIKNRDYEMLAQCFVNQKSSRSHDHIDRDIALHVIFSNNKRLTNILPKMKPFRIVYGYVWNNVNNCKTKLRIIVECTSAAYYNG